MLLRGKQANGLLTQQKMLRAAVKLFLEKRYEGATTAEDRPRRGHAAKLVFPGLSQ